MARWTYFAFCLASLALFPAMAAPAPITLMIVVDRSGSVLRAGTAPALRNALTEFVDLTSGGKPVFQETRDVIGLGSFAGTWKLDFAPSSLFRSGPGTLAQAIGKLPFEAGVTNTSEALYRAYEQLRALNRVKSVNVILLITDGRPSAFTATFRAKHRIRMGWAESRVYRSHGRTMLAATSDNQLWRRRHLYDGSI